uniref:Uncharacterized protein n=1 Tax=Tanacetum cinerariifolium TaxID=118510 RepID=A0A699JEY0_TANCI|nr:hypothetical protein [Tanacetum cinerariifolium]
MNNLDHDPIILTGRSPISIIPFDYDVKMQIVDHDPTILTGRSPISIIQQLPFLQEDHLLEMEKLPEFNTTSMEMEPSDIYSNTPTGDVTIHIPSSSVTTSRSAELPSGYVL